jgi:hypothetical protein
MTSMEMVKTRRKIKPSQWVQKVFRLNGQPFNIDEYPYMHRIYDTPAKELGFFCGRQVAKSTTLASILVQKGVTIPNSSQVVVSPLQEQAYVFSTTRLRDFLYDSPLIKQCYMSGGGVVDQMLRKQMANGSTISLGYALRTADRLRGRSIVGDGALLCYDEIQDIFPDVIPVVNEMAFRTPGAVKMFAGTPKSTSNHMEAMRRRSTGCEWAVKCHHTGCGHWNMDWDENNIGNSGVICAKCGGLLDTDRGQWVARRKLDIHRGKDATVTMEAYRIPQLIVKPIMSREEKWVELLGKLREYSTEKLYNEVFGLPFDSGTQPVTLEQLRKCCDPNRENKIPKFNEKGLPPLCMGIDWAFMGEDSYTFALIGGWKQFPHDFQVYYWKIFKGRETDPQFQIDWIVSVMKENPNIQIVGADWGAGHVQNIQLVNSLGEDRVLQLWHTGLKGAGGLGSRAKYDQKGRKWHLARTRVMTDGFELCRRQQVTFPRAEDCGELFDHFLAIMLEFHEETNRAFYTHVDPDDGFHSFVFCQLAAEYYMQGDFTGHGGTINVTTKVENQHDHAYEEGVSMDDYYYADEDVGMYE